MQKAAAVLLLVIFGYSAISQENSVLSGHVFDDDFKTPIENVILTINLISHEFISDKSGFFEARDLPPGNYVLSIKHVSYVIKEENISIGKNENLVLDFYLKLKIEPLGEVVVEEDRLYGRIISRLPYIETQFPKNQIEGEATRDITDFLRSSKNINGIRKGGTQLDPVVRGFKYGQLNVQMNSGQKIEGGCPNRMDPATAHVEIEDIQSIEVIKGPYALKYGPMFGGLINLNTEIPPHSDSSWVHLNAASSYESNWNGYKQHLGVFGGYRWLYYNFSGGFKNYQNYSDGNGDEVKSSFRKYQYKGQIGFVPFENQTLSFNFEESHGRDIRFPTLPMDERADDTRLLSAEYKAAELEHVLNSFLVKIYHSDVQHQMDNKYRPFSDTVVAVSDIHAVNRGGRFETGWGIHKGKLLAGLDFENILKDGERVKNMIKQPGLPVKKEKLWNDAEISNLGAFVEYSLPMGKWELLGAMRLDFNRGSSGDIVIQQPTFGEIYYYSADSTKSEFVNFSFNLGATRTLSDHWAVSLALGRGVRSPDMIERFIILLPIGYDKFDYLGNPQLNPEANNQADLTFKYRGNKLGKMQVNGFYSLINDFIAGKRLPPVVQKPLTKDVLGVKQFYNAGNARLYGFEFSYASPASHNLGASLFASYTRGTIDEVLKYVTDGNGEVTGDELISNDAMTEIPPLEATAMIYYRLFNGKLLPEFNVRFVSKQNHVSEASYEQTSPGFIVAGFSFDYLFNSYVSLSAGVNNLFDVAYYEHLNRNIIGSSTNLYEPGRSFYFNLYFKF